MDPISVWGHKRGTYNYVGALLPFGDTVTARGTITIWEAYGDIVTVWALKMGLYRNGEGADKARSLRGLCSIFYRGKSWLEVEDERSGERSTQIFTCTIDFWEKIYK